MFSLLSYNQVGAHEFFNNIIIHNTPNILGIIAVPNNRTHLTLGQFINVDEITLNAEEIEYIFRLEHFSKSKMGLILEEDNRRCEDVGTCDGLDHFHWARVAATIRCDSEAFINPMEYNDYGAVPVFTGPESFVNYESGEVSDEHHSYTIYEGVSFYCQELVVDDSY